MNHYRHPPVGLFESKKSPVPARCPLQLAPLARLLGPSRPGRVGLQLAPLARLRALPGPAGLQPPGTEQPVEARSATRGGDQELLLYVGWAVGNAGRHCHSVRHFEK